MSHLLEVMEMLRDDLADAIDPRNPDQDIADALRVVTAWIRTITIDNHIVKIESVTAEILRPLRIAFTRLHYGDIVATIIDKQLAVNMLLIHTYGDWRVERDYRGAR